MITRPNFQEEQKLWEKGYDIVIGIDEVGRGAFAGPVVVGAVAFSPYSIIDDELILINDSKLLKPIERKKASKVIEKLAFYHSVDQCTVSIINRIGIGKATEMAFRKLLNHAQSAFPNSNMFVLVDGFCIKYIRNIGLKRQKAIIKGDQKSISIAAASIIAKVHRDYLMVKLHATFPVYGFSKHKGYGTSYHQAMIKKYKLSKVHRTSFNLNKFMST